MYDTPVWYTKSRQNRRDKASGAVVDPCWPEARTKQLQYYTWRLKFSRIRLYKLNLASNTNLELAWGVKYILANKPALKSSRSGSKVSGNGHPLLYPVMPTLDGDGPIWQQ